MVGSMQGIILVTGLNVTMTSDTVGSQVATESAIDPSVRELLKRLEEQNSLSRGTIVDFATVSKGDPYENFSLDKSKITNASRKRLESIVSTDKYQDCIAFAVELDSGDVFLDFFTYKSSPTDEYPSVESLALKLGVDISSVHHLTGKDVDVRLQDGHWIVAETVERESTNSTVTKHDFLNPLAIGGLLVPLGALIGWQTTVPLTHSTGVGIVLSVVAYAFLLYLTLASKRDHPLPGVLGRLFIPDHSSQVGILSEEDNITDIEYGEFNRLFTLAEEEELEDERAVLHNLAIDVTLPPSGRKTVPVPSPTTGWDGTTIKALVYNLSSSVETLDRATGQLVPLEAEDGRVQVDTSRLETRQTRELTFGEKFADRYVTWINSKFGAEKRQELYQ